MSSWEDELQHLLNELGVELEQAQQKQAEHESALVVTHASLSHPGCALSNNDSRFAR
jgi:hypothetical protein